MLKIGLFIIAFERQSTHDRLLFSCLIIVPQSCIKTTEDTLNSNVQTIIAVTNTERID